MGNSYISCYVHFVFSTKHHEKWLIPSIKEKIFSYIRGIARENGFKLIKAGEIEDHVHLLVSLSATISISNAAKYIKGGSSRWIHNNYKNMRSFAWQEGYGAFSVSISQLDRTIEYIANQETHHRHKTFKKEIIEFLKFHGIDFDEKYLK